MNIERELSVLVYFKMMRVCARARACVCVCVCVCSLRKFSSLLMGVFLKKYLIYFKNIYFSFKREGDICLLMADSRSCTAETDMTL